MKFLLDTMVVSEWVKPRPDAGVLAWLSTTDEDCIFLSIVTLAELRYGIARRAAGSRRNRLDNWLRNDLAERFAGRIIPVDRLIADYWGVTVARTEAAGRSTSTMDAFIAATALAHDMTLVTRNTSHFQASLTQMINPWANEEGRPG
jgi:predicted nucleic acid-binding protein